MKIFRRQPFFRPSRIAGWEVTPGEPTLQINATQPFASELMTVLQPEAGQYRFQKLPGLIIVVERSVITNGEGNVVETVG